MAVRYDPNHDCYTILGVGSLATREEIERAFREEGRRLHPDKHPGREAEMTERFQRLAEAHQTLKDEATRARYDDARRRYFQPPAPAPEPAPETPERASAEPSGAPAREEEEEPYWKRRKYVYSVSAGTTDAEREARRAEADRRRPGYFSYRDFFKNLSTFAVVGLAVYAGIVAYAVWTRDLEFAARHGVIDVVRLGGFAPGAEGSSENPIRWAQAVAVALGAAGAVLGAAYLVRQLIRWRRERMRT